jgi:quinol monooxygenase YgiN
MIIVMGHIRMADGEIDRLGGEMTTQMLATRAEDGCVQYDFSRVVADPNLLLISEKWRDQDALQAHSKTPHMAVFNSVIGSAKIESINVQAFDASNMRQLIGGD